MENFKVVIGVVIAIVLLLLAGCFILVLVTYYNKRKKTFIDEKRNLETAFNNLLLHSQLEIQEQTFNTISDEIHDNVGQLLSLTKLQLYTLNENATFDSQLITEARDNVSKVIVDLRDIAKALSSDHLKSLTLEEATTAELARINRSGNIACLVNSTGIDRQVSEQKKLILFRMMQECLQNIIKHAEADNVTVTFNYQIHFLEITVEDDGIGFNLSSKAEKDGLGLRNLVKRISLISGNCTINSSQGLGTSIIFSIPYN